MYQAVVPAASEQPATWRYTTAKPADGWFKPDFDAKDWKEGPSGFGTRGTPGGEVRTEWKTPDIWLRRDFTLPDRQLGELFLLIHHDEDAEIYLTGVLAAKLSGYLTRYEEAPIAASAAKTLQAGKNTIAIHCHQEIPRQKHPA